MNYAEEAFPNGRTVFGLPVNHWHRRKQAGGPVKITRDLSSPGGCVVAPAGATDVADTLDDAFK